uniref:C2H2-type domain-containing protein n=1 Tax=Phlebotomus papatasi TaxID=29031 RepID=A0A1B0EWW7_PHLPP
MLTSKKKAILYEFVVDLLVKGIITYKYPDNHIQKSHIKKIFRSYLIKHGAFDQFYQDNLSSILEECKIIDPLEGSRKDDRTIYKFSSERLLELIKKFTKVGKFFTLKGLIDPEPSELFVHHSVTFSSLTSGDAPYRYYCAICEMAFKLPRAYEDHMRFHVNCAIPRTAKVFPQSFKLSVVEITMQNVVLEIANRLDTYQSIQRIQLISPSYMNIPISVSNWPIFLDEGKSIVLEVPRIVFQDIFEVMGIWKIVFKFNGKKVSRGTEVYDLVKLIAEEETKDNDELKLYRTLQHYPTYEMEALFNRDFTIDGKTNSLEINLYRKLNEYNTADRSTRLRQSNYVEVMSHSLQIEELSVGREVRKYNRCDQMLHNYGRHLYSLDIENVSEMRPSILPFDRICLISQDEYFFTQPPYDSKTIADAEKIFGSIVRIECDSILVRIWEEIRTDVKYHVSFLPNRSNFRIEGHALYLLKNSPKLQSILFPTEPPAPINSLAKKEPIWFNKCVAQNAEQKRAIMHIVAGTAYPCPYIIFGPPGTGKTLTVVEAVCQLWKQQKNSHILITAQSNSACDEIVLRLLRYLPSCDILRMFSKVKEKELPMMDPELARVANVKGDFLYYPPLKRIYELVQARIDTKHFSHVFIDESGCCTETQTIVPIVGVIANEHNIHGQIILAGDHKQLGPVLTSSLARDRDYHISMMERLINSPVYKKNVATNEYNANLVTKLIHNYRSYPPLLDISNIMFYDDELISNVDNDWALHWKFLPNKGIPIVMDPIVGYCDQDYDSPSYFNIEEVNAVMTIIEEILSNGINSRKIKESHLGIIAPYRKQVMKIREKCTARNWNDIDVGSVELFQGKEKEVIIVSTVRSQRRSLGFLSDPKRLNVLLTRAKALLIIVGNPGTLKNDKNWRFVVDLCREYGLITTLSYNMRFSKYFDEVLTGMTIDFRRMNL